MRPDGVVVPSPTLDDDLGLAQHVEDLAVEQLVAQARIEALDEAVLPWTARGDVGGLCADGADPILHGLGDKLRAVVGTDVLGNPAQQLGDLAIAVAAIPPGQLDNVGGQLLFILTAPRHLALRRAMLPERGTGPALGNRQRVSNMLDAGAATRGA